VSEEAHPIQLSDQMWVVTRSIVGTTWFARKSCPSWAAHGDDEMPVRLLPAPGLRNTLRRFHVVSVMWMGSLPMCLRRFCVHRHPVGWVRNLVCNASYVVLSLHVTFIDTRVPMDAVEYRLHTLHNRLLIDAAWQSAV
jgi:hypothetical protein